MRKFVLLLALAGLPCAGQTRPPILGVSHLAVYASNMARTEHFYVHDVGLMKGTDPENAKGVRYYVNREQFIEVLPLPAGEGINRLDAIGWITTNAEQMREYLGAHGVKVPSAVQHGADGSAWFAVKDPEGNTVEFNQPPAKVLKMSLKEIYDLPGKADPIGRRIIHCGEMVRNRAKEDTFYRGLLGFRPYWYGGMKAGKTDWVAQQVPNGHDWLEYMLTSGPSGSGIPAHMSQKQLGVLNHFSLGIANMEQAVTTLDSGGRLADNEHAGPQIGRDGKWQFNMYDPDGTRVELMEYSASEPPCCSEFTAISPTDGNQP